VKKPSILIVEDDPVIRVMTGDLLAQEGFSVAAASGCGEARKALADGIPDLLLLDLNLPDGDGLDFCRRLLARESTRRLNVFMLTARGAVEDIVEGLEAGAQEYMVKPFNPREFLARVKAILRRRGGAAAPKKELASGGLRLSLRTRQVWVHGKDAKLTLREFELLRVLMGQVGRIFSRQEIIAEGWEPALAIAEGVIDVHVSHVRSKLGKEGRRIETIRTVGLRLAPPP
jgi:DNA-binding response OmpR family regulator